MSFVSVLGLNKTYQTATQRLHVLRDVALEVDAGEMVAIVGASGVGKSTLLHVLGGLDRAEAGTIRVGETDLRAIGDEALVAFRNRHVGFVFQFHHLLPEFEAVENVEMPMRIARAGLGEARRRALDLLDRVGLSERASHRPNMLSGGEQQRVAVARALVTRPALLLADEPTGNLDSKSAAEVFALFRTFNREFGCAVLLVTHDARLSSQCDRTVTLVDGNIESDTATPAAGA